jgi:glycosyltransferase involved in cell wall biosynthesis
VTKVPAPDPPPPDSPARHLLVLNWLDRENPRAGGAEVHLHEIFGRLARDGWRITLVSSGWAEAEERTNLDGITVHRVGSRNTYPIPAIHRARRILSEEPVDLVVEDLNKVPLFAPLWCSKPVLLLVHHLFGATAFQEAPLYLALPTWLLERPVGRLYRGVPTVAVSDSTRDDLVHRGLDPDDVEVIPNGIDLDRFAPAPPGGRFPRPTLLYLGRLKKYKRVDLILEAATRLGKEGRDLEVLIAGKGDHRSELEKKASRAIEAGVSVRFLGFVSEERKRELLARSWVHCLTSPKEGWGIANLEAAASGTPTVASDSPGLRDSVMDGRTGFLVPHDDVGTLAGRLGELLDDPDLRDRLGRQGRAFAEGFSWDRSAQRMATSIRRVVASV